MRTFQVALLESKELDRVVKVYIKLPKSYYESNSHYPVLYMHDGQVGFNDYEKDELDFGLLEDYVNSPNPEVILVGIANRDTRVNELLPFEVDRGERGKIGGKTDLYLEFIVHTLKPHIDTTYRTKKEPESTGMMGISLGGMATFYALAKYNQHFTRFAMISSAHYRFHDRLVEVINQSDLHSVLKVYSDVGTMENDKEDVREKYLTSNQQMSEVLNNTLNEDVFKFQIVEGSKHEFPFWNKRVPSIIQYMFQ